MSHFHIDSRKCEPSPAAWSLTSFVQSSTLRPSLQAQILAAVGRYQIALHHAGRGLAHFLRIDNHLDIPFVPAIKAETDETILARIDNLH